MKFFKLMHRGLALLLLLAMLVTLMPSAFAAEQGNIDNDIVIDVPEKFKDEDVVVATFGEDGKIVYDFASDDVRNAIDAGREDGTYADVTDMLTNRAGTDFSAGQRLAFFIDPSNSEGNSNYVSYSLTAAIVKNLVAAGVTDLFVMTKNRAGTFSLTNLKTANTNKGSAKVYAWMHCARDDAYLKSNKESAQYHYRAGFNNAQNGGDSSVTGFVNLGYAAYITYMEGLVKQATSYSDGLLLDSLLFGTEYTGWGQEARDYMGKTNYNNAVKAMCATAYEQYASTYRYKADSNGYYAYVSSGGSTNTSGNTLADDISTDAVKSLGNYRKSVITTFIGKMKAAYGSSKIIAVALERYWENTNYYKYIHGQDPWNFRSYVNKGFCVTMQVVDNHTTSPVSLAKSVAKYTNVMIGVDFYKVGSYGNYGYTYPDTIVDLAESIYTARYDVNGAYATYRGSILGAACYTAGHIGAMKVTLSGSGAKPTLTAVSAHPNQKTTAMMAYFNAHGDSDCGTQTTDGSLLKPSGSTIQYFANKNSSGNGAYGYIGSYSTYTGANVAAFGASTIVVALKNYTVDWDKLPFARIAYYVPNSLSTTADTVGHFPIYFVKGHETCTSFTDTVLVTATCTSIGYKRRTCKTCGYDFIVEVAKLGHSYTSAVTTQPTCEKTGVKTYTCSRSGCGNSYTESIAALGHSYSSVVTPPTCTADGYTTYTCSICNGSYVGDTVTALGHSYKTDVLKETCTTDGYTTYTCTVCNYSYVGDHKTATGHNYNSVVTKPTCTEGGYTVVTCSGCSDTYVENIVAALGHNYKGQTALEPTCTEEGVMVYTCANCNDSYNETLPLAGHTYFTETTEVTCTTDGYTVYTCGDCNYTYTGDIITALGHDYNAVKTEVTCFDDGYTTYTCKNCNDSYVSDYVEATGHSYSVEVIAPTCTESGYSIFTCVCGDRFTGEEEAPTGHSLSYKDNGDTHTATCGVCDYSIDEPHELENYTCIHCGAFCCKHEKTSIAVDVEATCTTDGTHRTVCDLCGNTLATETVAATGHDKAKVLAKAATCTEPGNREYWTCNNCGKCYADETFAYEIPDYYITIAAKGHKYYTEVIAPTCTEVGYTSHICATCGDSYQTDETEVLGHSYEAVVTAPTCAAVGYTTYTCTCGDSYTADEVAELGHLYNVVVTAPTCTEAGYTTFTCVTCGDSYTDNEVEALGHSYEAVVTAPTCTEAGYTTYTCACGYSYVGDEAAATGHAYTYTNNGENHVVGCENCALAETADHEFVDGTCICGAVESTEPELKPDANLACSTSITVGAEMQVVYTVIANKVAAYESFYLEVSKNVVGGDPVVTTFGLDEGMTQMQVLTNTSGKVTGYRATYTGINAKEMGDEFTATLYAVAADGTVYYGNSATSSIKSFLTGKLTDNNSSATLKTLAVDMLNYGAAAQVNFAYNTENLSNADLTEEQKALGTQTNPEAADAGSVSGDGINLTASVTVKSKVELTLTCMYKTEDASNVKFIFKDKDGKVLAELAPSNHIANKAVQCVYDQVGAKQMRELITIEVYDGDTLVSKTLTWSIESYVASTLAKTSTGEILANMVNAMLIYGDSAAAYLTTGN